MHFKEYRFTVVQIYDLHPMLIIIYQYFIVHSIGTPLPFALISFSHAGNFSSVRLRWNIFWSHKEYILFWHKYLNVSYTPWVFPWLEWKRKQLLMKVRIQSFASKHCKGSKGYNDISWGWWWEHRIFFSLKELVDQSLEG